MTSLPSKSGLQKLSFKALAAIAAFGAGALGAAVAGMSPEAVIAGRFTTALEQSAPADLGLEKVQVAGTEEFWLNAGGRVAAPIEPAAWGQGAVAPSSLTFAVGDKVTVTRDGTERTLKIVSVSAPFKDGAGLSLRVTAEEAGNVKAAPVVFTVPAPHKPEAGKPRAS